MVRRRCFGELVKNVEIPLVRDLPYHSRLLQQVIVDIRSYWLALRIELNLQVFSESRRVVVPQRFRIAKRLEQRVRGQHRVLYLLDRAIAAP